MVQSSIYPKRMCLCACVCVRVCTHSSVVEVGRDTLIFIDHLHSSGGFPGGSDVKNLPAMQETQVRSLGGEDPLDKGMATPSSILA